LEKQNKFELRKKILLGCHKRSYCRRRLRVQQEED